MPVLEGVPVLEDEPGVVEEPLSMLAGRSVALRKRNERCACGSDA
jgi:hypothetical protein